ncbi:MAG: hypothetical protein ACD_38C00156G0004 [uncultured bacterium]|uniref:Guanylate kinase n=1 Tax=Candidatus Daviesbacteria bacterium GW2011_GWC2_40_12 TaxID=1618431 RepID=A0A0G0QQJ1_9BACT|nr:MAG: hypothetical protein ACD_38C00156G0004 [uncultured bacterium]KKR16800.1 MAG: Guanylate kinase [Candidatus Daviesbacteria bacterium GW2011_GWA2_39_33]KKR24636.1 MAG: Guanylate kinase [Candidatus Daviesbacteria bacterium GW2011_GWB1_39_5]KKR42418.1 MAG: Guanylate kinase [Candidatus Daviesbacteria bacterium GW2011_GWC2_40_12]OGE22331.1 MAG: hypothetical protein A2778_00595 [Candidatus Daviesbacteria bacterium RIFCSPHIGHO2_01_FULL_40_24]OGE28418.1 MAG: hypothetical protein A3C29_05590 [Can
MKSAKSLIVLTGKTTSGKDTVASKLQQKFPNLKKILTTTSRPPRNSETNGIDYDFLSEDKFKQKITEGDFIEHVEYGGNLYGTQKCQIANNLGHDLIWRIDPSRAGKVREFIKDSFDQSRADDLLKRIVVIYLTVSDEVVLERLKKRGISQAEINHRMQEDKLFWEQYQDNYDFVIENIPGKLKETVDKIVKILENHIL